MLHHTLFAFRLDDNSKVVAIAACAVVVIDGEVSVMAVEKKMDKDTVGFPLFTVQPRLR